MVPFTREVAESIPEGYILEVVYSLDPSNIFYLSRHSKYGLSWVERRNKSKVTGIYVFVEWFPKNYLALNPYTPEGGIL